MKILLLVIISVLSVSSYAESLPEVLSRKSPAEIRDMIEKRSNQLTKDMRLILSDEKVLSQITKGSVSIQIKEAIPKQGYSADDGRRVYEITNLPTLGGECIVEVRVVPKLKCNIRCIEVDVIEMGIQLCKTPVGAIGVSN